MKRILRLPESNPQLRTNLHTEESAVPMRQLSGRQNICDLLAPIAGEQPLFHERTNVIQLRCLNQHRRHSRRPSSDKLKVPNRREKCSPAALRILPPLALFKAKSRKQAGDTVKLSLRGDRAHKRNSLNHRFDCIVWSAKQACPRSGL